MSAPRTIRTAHRTYLSLIFTLLLLHPPSTPLPPLKLHIFSTPKPFSHAQDARTQTRAINTWKALTSHITLLGGTEAQSIARRLGVGWKRVDQTWRGVPMLNAMIDAMRADAVVVFVNADICLYHDLLWALGKLKRDMPDGWIAISARRDVDRIRGWEKDREGVLHTYGGVDMWAWSGTVGGGYIPPFVMGRGRYDNWLTNQLIQSGVVVDVSHVATLAHQRHDHHLVGVDANWKEWRAYEQLVNAYLAERFGRFENQMGTILHAPYVLMQCADHAICLLKRRRPGLCRCEYSSFVQSTLSDAFVVNGSRVIMCGLQSRAQGEAYRERVSLDSNSGVGLPLTKEVILQRMALKWGRNANTIILIVTDYSQRLQTLRLICSLRRAQIFDHLLIAATDKRAYIYCLTHGLPVYLHGPHPNAQLEIMWSLLPHYQMLSLLPSVVFSQRMWMYVTGRGKNVDVGVGRNALWVRGEAGKGLVKKVLERLGTGEGVERVVLEEGCLGGGGGGGGGGCMGGVRVEVMEEGEADVVPMRGEVCVYD